MHSHQKEQLIPDLRTWNGSSVSGVKGDERLLVEIGTCLQNKIKQLDLILPYVSSRMPRLIFSTQRSQRQREGGIHALEHMGRHLRRHVTRCYSHQLYEVGSYLHFIEQETKT